MAEPIAGTRAELHEQQRPIERRRYALLQAAATVYSVSHDNPPEESDGTLTETASAAVAIAEYLLAEIERRDQAREGE